MTAVPTISGRERWLFGVGAVATGVINNGLAYFMLFYYNQVLGLPGSYAGTAILISMIFDSISDPAIGVWSDRMQSRWGRRHPFMYVSAFPVMILYGLIWYPPELSDFGLFIYLAAVTTALRFFSTLFEIPSMSLLVELTDDYDERTRLAGLRIMLGWVGGLAMAFLMWGYFMATWGEQNALTFQLSGLLGACVAFFAIVVSSIGLHGRIPYLKTPPKREAWKMSQFVSELRVTLSNRNFLALFIAAIFAAIAGGIKTNFESFVMLHFWEFSPEQVQWIFAGLIISSILAAYLAPKVTRRFDKRGGAIRVYALSIIFAALPYILRLTGYFPENDSAYLYPIMMVHQILDVTIIVMSLIILSSMLADVVEDSETRTGRREEGLFFSAQTFAAKVSTGFGVLFAGVTLDLINFPEAAVPGEVAAEIVWKLGFVFGPAMMFFFCLALGAISFYGITREQHNERLQALRAD